MSGGSAGLGLGFTRRIIQSLIDFIEEHSAPIAIIFGFSIGFLTILLGVIGLVIYIVRAEGK